jgi:tRNA pseudouridine38-40 synthase
MRFRIELSYMGTDFAGWQNQINATSIQELIEKGLTTLLRTKIEITGSSRTDAGVHASQQFAHFDFAENLDLPDLSYRLNQILPFSIHIVAIVKVSDTFHARFDATSRAYEYRITKVKNPFLQYLAYQFSSNLAIDQMNEACNLMLKHTEFQSFSKLHTDVKTFNCELIHAYWNQESNLTVFHIKANRFLRGMVRAIVGTMLEVGLGKINLDQFEQILLSKNRQKAGVSVPAKGLFLVEVNY